ncbi:MAG TPA: hypothetical protein VMV72_02485 [Verrucomicrobiae bacterium]|nr:hypothetical protein [Verrucomicrobiae bacterium]
MNSPTRRYLVILWAIAAAHGGAAVRAADPTHDFNRYQVILDKAPFGQVGASADNVPQPSFSTRFTFVGIASEGEDKPLLAIIEEKDTKHVDFKSEGENIGPVKIVKVERSETGPDKLVMKQDLEVATLTMEAKPGTGPAGAPAPGQPPLPGQPPAATSQPGLRRIPFRR